MGTIAARDAMRVLELTETVAAIRAPRRVPGGRPARPRRRPRRARAVHAAVRRRVPVNDADRRQDVDIEAIVQLVRGSGGLSLGEPAEP